MTSKTICGMAGKSLMRIARFTKITNSTKSALLTTGGIVALSLCFQRAASGTSLAFVRMWVRERLVLASPVEKGGEQNAERNPNMTCRIDRFVIGPGLLILHISGQITGKDADLLRSLLEQDKDVVAIDLKDVLLVDREAVRLLVLSELNGTELRNCPAYIREWVTRERAVIKPDSEL